MATSSSSPGTTTDMLAELENIMRKGQKCVSLPLHAVDEVYPGIYVGGKQIALDKPRLKQLGITHVLNCAQGSKFHHVDTDKEFYEDVNIKFLGLHVSDFPQSDIKQHFGKAVRFIEKALTEENGKVLVHCVQGFSRSASVAMAFLMMQRGMSVQEAARTVREGREVCPNGGFLKQLCELDRELHKSKTTCELT